MATNFGEKEIAGKLLDLTALQKALPGQGVKAFLERARARYLFTRGLRAKLPPAPRLDALLDRVGAELDKRANDLWGTQQFQLLFRATRPEHLRLLGIEESAISGSEKSIAAGRVMSLLPYNALLRENTIKKFIPSRPERYSGSWRHSMDPYGIFRAMDRVLAIDGQGNKTYLATRKFPYAVLVNVTEACHIGCDGCYKGSMVRTSMASLSSVYPEYAKIKQQLNLEEKRVIRQAQLLTQWLNNHHEVDTIVLSGGEPLLFSNHAMKAILDEFSKTKHIHVVRLCTSSVFQGMWYRIDDELAKILQSFEQSTGKQFYVNAHVTDEHQLSTPESRLAVEKLQQHGISIHLQLPIQEGINFQRDNIPWSIQKLKAIGKQAYALGVIPYKMIVDMHSPSHPDLTVPLETFSKVIAFLDHHLEHSDHERWQAHNVLHEQGNAYVYPNPHFVAEKEIDTKNKRVTYFIPKLDWSRGENWVIHAYEEPLIEGHNDNPNSLPSIRDKKLIQKILEVKERYHALQNKESELESGNLSFEQKAKEMEAMERLFYATSGIHYPKNDPLQV